MEKMEEELKAARTDSEIAKEKARSSGQALIEVKVALNFPVDTTNRSRIYEKSGGDGRQEP